MAFLTTYKFKNIFEITNALAIINIWKHPK
jgi:hypothetical protein